MISSHNCPPPNSSCGHVGHFALSSSRQTSRRVGPTRYTEKLKVALATSSTVYSWRSVRRGKPRTPITTIESPATKETWGGFSGIGTSMPNRTRHSRDRRFVRRIQAGHDAPQQDFFNSFHRQSFPGDCNIAREHPVGQRKSEIGSRHSVSTLHMQQKFFCSTHHAFAK